MDGRMSIVLLVCVWCSLDAGGLLMIATAQPTVSAEILTPEADRKAGGQVDMRCTAMNLQSDHIVSWSATNPDRVLRLGDVNVTAESRFMFSTQKDMTTGRTFRQDFTIINAQREDSNMYVCKVNDPTTDGAYNVIVSSNVTLLVLYFPNASFPICFPAGPVTVDEGTYLKMRCTSESDHRAVTAVVSHSFYTARYTPWTSQVVDDTDTLIRTSSLTADVADNCIVFTCTITSVNFPNMERSCTIGPITITPSASDSTPTRTLCMNVSSMPPTEMGYPTPITPFNDTSSFASSSFSPAVIAGLVSAAVVSLLLTIILIITCRKRRLAFSDPKPVQSNSQTNTELNLSRLDNTRISPNDEYGGLDTLQEGLQNNTMYLSTQHHDVGASGTMTAQRAQATDPSLIYAKPYQAHPTARVSMRQQPNQSFEPTTDNGQRYAVFNASDVSTRPSRGGLLTSPKPTATVKPNPSSRSKPPKPKPYQPKSAQRNNPLTHSDNQMVPSQIHPVSIPTHPDTGPSTQEEAHPAPSDPTYTQVSRPMRLQSTHDNPDHIVYAELDLQSDEFQDGGLPSPSSSDAVTYASVMRNQFLQS